MNKKEKIEFARKLNIQYNTGGKTFESLQESWNQIELECHKAGIKSDLIRIYPDVFEMIAKHKAIEQYFYETK